MATAIRGIELSKLRLGDESEWSETINARNPDAEMSIDNLADQIAQNDFTLIQGLGAVKGLDKRGHEAFGVFAGGRRLRALRKLAKDGRIKDSHAVDVVIHDVPGWRALEMSVAENDPAYRLPPHPLDQCKAFVKIIGDGKSIEDVAAYFVVKPRFVEQRLALGRLSPKLMAAWMAGQLNDKAAETFTLSTNHKVQEDTYASLKKKHQLWDGAIRSALTHGNANLGKLLKFVGAEAYKLRGGNIIVDLFSDNSGGAIPEDADLVRTMASEKIDAKRKDLTEAGWSFVGTEVELGPDAPHWKRRKVDLDFAGDKKTHAELVKEREKTDQFTNKFDTLTERIERFEEEARARSYTAEDRAKAGVLMNFDQHDGKLQVYYGLVKPAEGKAGKAKSASKANADGPKKDPNELSAALLADLGGQMTAAAEIVLTADHQVALCVLCAGAMTYDYESPAKVTVEGQGELGEGERPFTENLKTMLAKTPAERLAFLAALAASSIDINFNNDVHQEAATALASACNGKAFDTAMRKTFDATRYFNGVSKFLILQAITEAVGADQAKAVANKAKADIVKTAVEQVPATGWLPPQLRAKHYPGPGGKAKTGAKSAKKGGKKRR